MKLDTIKTQLNTLDAAITGVKRAYAEEPDVAPTNADCPFIINAKMTPFLTPRWGSGGGEIIWTYHFKTLFGLEPIGLDAAEYWNDAIASYPSRIIASRMGKLTLGNNVDTQDAGDFNVGIIQYRGGRYFGFELEWIVREREAITATA